MRREWTEQEVSYLKEHYPYTEAREIANHLDRSIKSVQKKANKLDLTKSIITRKSLRKQAEGIKDLLEPSMEEYDWVEISKMLGITIYEAKEAYASALEKMVAYVKSNDKLADELVSLLCVDEKFVEWDFKI